ncbi:MAG TPA: sulfatase [Planctomycetaceae bacterium]|nr:sulfatase [Planctomycetaceae bacterium]
MINKQWVLVIGFTLFALPAGLAAKQPNFVFFLVDDLGYMDIGANNPQTFYETPHVDALAREAMRFTDGYAANPVCSPTRYSIMTGKYPSRVDATNFFSGKRAGRFLPAPLHDRMPLEEFTLAEALSKGGYRTAFLGKWHLGPTEAYWPEHQGFDVNIGGHARGMPRSYFSPYANPRLADGPRGEHLTERLTDEAVGLIEKFQADPFLLYLSFYTVHTPLRAPKELVAKYQKKAERLSGRPEFAPEEQVLPGGRERQVRILQKHATYAAMVESMDASVGRVIDKLKQAGLYDNTVICFMSDNGGLSTSEGSPTSNLPLRGGKGWLYEGGIREPFMIRWPGVTDQGGTCSQPVISTDFYPTMLEIAGLESRPQQHRDGESLVGLLKGDGQLQRETLYWHYPHYSNQGGFPGGAIRQGKWKLIERFEDGSIQLYDLQADLGERTNVADDNPDLVQTLRRKLHAWYQDVDAKFLRSKPGGLEPWRP